MVSHFSNDLHLSSSAFGNEAAIPSPSIYRRG